MENGFAEKLLNILLEISEKIGPIYFWKDYTFWISLINIVVLIITLLWLVRYTHATEKMADYQLMPAVDVNMIYEKSIGKTYFWFLNASSMPAFVSIEFNINEKSKGKIAPLRIPPYHPNYPQLKRTDISFDFLNGNLIDGTNLILNIIITPAFNDNKIKIKFTKSYRFNKSKFQWDETSWSCPDPPFPT